MKRALLLALAACGGKPAAKAPEVSAVPLTRVPVEEEPDDGVTVISDKGHVDAKVAEAAIAPHREALTQCFVSKVGKRRWLGGQLTLRWDVAADGAINSVTLPDNDVGAWPIEQCILGVAREIAFGVPISGAAEVTLPMAFPARSAASAWEDADSEAAVGNRRDKLAACGKKLSAPDAVTITLYVGPHGTVQSVGFTSAEAIDDAWATCAEKAILAWQLPDPKGQVAKLKVGYGRQWTSHRPKSSS